MPLHEEGKAHGEHARARLLDGVAAARELSAANARACAALTARGVLPTLAVVVVGEDPASAIYVRHKMRACEAAGVRSQGIALGAGADPSELFAVLARLNADPGIHGILVQLPLPPEYDTVQVCEAIAPEKDVDAFGVAHLGALTAGRPAFAPCTPSGILALLDRERIEVRGKEAVVIGRSNIVGKPLALMLMARGATVTVCHSQTRDLACHTRRAELLFVAAGRAGLVTADMVRPGAVVVDVGIHRLDDGRIGGDVDFAGVVRVAGYITPVPGGVGPMTVAALVANTVRAAEAMRPRPASVSLS